MVPRKRRNEDEKTIEGYYQKMDPEEDQDKDPFLGGSRQGDNSGAYIPPAKDAPDNSI